jgi:hypothetical protein
MPANNYFLRKLASDELWDTMFFASGEVPTKVKSSDFTILKTKLFEAKIITHRRITVNGVKCASVPAAKLFIQENL